MTASVLLVGDVGLDGTQVVSLDDAHAHLDGISVLVVALDALGAEPAAALRGVVDGRSGLAVAVVVPPGTSDAERMALVAAGAHEVLHAPIEPWRVEAAGARALRLADAEGRARYFAVLHAKASEGQAVIAPDGTVLATDVTRGFAEGPTWAPFCRVAPRSAEAFAAAVAQAVALPRSTVELDEAEIIDTDGVHHEVEIVISNLIDEPTVGGLLLSYWDISLRLRTAEAIAFQANLLAAVAQAVIAVDRANRIVYWNAAATDLYGWSTREAIGRDLNELFAEVRATDESRQAMAEGRSWSGEMEVPHRDGRLLPISVTCTPMFDHGGELLAVITVSSDISARREAEAGLRRLAAIVDSTADAVISIDLDGTITSWNPAAERLYGWSAAEIVGRSISEIARPQRWEELAGVLAVVGAGGSIEQRREQHGRRDGSPVEVSVTVTPLRGGGGVIVGVSALVHDVTHEVLAAEQRAAAETARREAEAELEHRALHDDLTGLPNRVLLTDRLDHALATSGGRGVGVVFVDVDGFSHINDVLGHDAGDRTLVEIARRLQGAIRPTDTVARFGGDEFVVLCQDVDVDQLATMSERLAVAVEAPIQLRGRRVGIHVGLGITMSRPGSTSRSLLSEADAAVLRAKELGRGQAAVFDESLRAKATALLEGEQALRAALDRGEIIPHFQPVVDLATGRAVGFEALARWQKGGRNTPLRPAAEWIGLAQSSGLIAELSEVILARAVAEAAEWNRDESGLWVAANLDASQLVETRLADIVDHMLQVAGLPPHLLHLEITETVVMHDIAASIAVLEDLRDLGVHLSIDDFGTGYSSLAYLRQLPVDTLKIDRTFIAELGDEGDASIVRAVLGLGQALGLSCVAEGVETSAQRAVLADLGCELGQGYLWSRPLAPGAARDWLGRGMARRP